MARRLSKSATALDQTKEALVRRESELREQMEKLERMIAEAPRLVEETLRKKREELLMRANEGGSRLDVSLTLQDKRHDSASAPRRRGSLRKERREGRIIFLVLVVALALVVVWLVSHLRF
jgi:t-SNARE complex subunit (syntaxin)